MSEFIQITRGQCSQVLSGMRRQHMLKMTPRYFSQVLKQIFLIGSIAIGVWGLELKTPNYWVFKEFVRM